MKLLSFLTCALLTSNVFAAPAVKVMLDGSDKRAACGEKFEGLISPVGDSKESLRLKLVPTGFSGKVKYSVMYTNNGYKDISLDKYVTVATKDSEVKVPVYAISDDRPFAVNQVFVTATDGKDKAVASFKYKVLRSMILEKSPEDEKDCFTMYKSEKITGIYTNTSSQPRRIEVEDRMDRSSYVSKGKSTGWNFRISPFNLVSIGANRDYLSQVSKGMSVETRINVDTKVSTGEAIILTRQLTLFKDAYRVKSVDTCGGIHDDGIAYYTHWLVSYPVAVVDLTSSNPMANLDVGYDDTASTCVDEANNGGEDDDIFVPDTATTSNVRASVGEENFAAAGSALADSSASNAERKGVFKKLWTKLFK